MNIMCHIYGSLCVLLSLKIKERNEKQAIIKFRNIKRFFLMNRIKHIITYSIILALNYYIFQNLKQVKPIFSFVMEFHFKV